MPTEEEKKAAEEASGKGYTDYSGMTEEEVMQTEQGKKASEGLDKAAFVTENYGWSDEEGGWVGKADNGKDVVVKPGGLMIVK